MLKTADLCDDFSDEDGFQIAFPVFSDYGGNITFSGKISTIRCFEDNSMVREAVAEDGDGGVLVIDAGASLRCAMLGDLLAEKAVKSNWSGVIMNGLIRDSADIGTMDLGVKALGTYPLKSVKKGLGERNVPVSFAGVTFNPGDYLYADHDGIITSPKALG